MSAPAAVPPPGRRTGRRILVIAVLVLASPWLLLFGRWGVAAVRCGHQPIETSDFAAANSYTLPGDGTYTHFPIFDGFACSMDQVRGRSHNTLT